MPTAIRLNLFKAGRPKRAKERTAKMIGKRPTKTSRHCRAQRKSGCEIFASSSALRASLASPRHIPEGSLHEALM